MDTGIVILRDDDGQLHERDPFCVAVWATGRLPDRARDELCHRPAVEKVGHVWLCAHHADQQHRVHLHHRDGWEARFNQRVEEEVQLRLLRREEEAEQERWRWSVVYYLRRADGLIKIGTSCRFEARLATLTREYGQLEVLATHQGDRKAERVHHNRFRSAHVGGEWFQPVPELLAHIEAIQQRRGLQVSPGG